MKYILKMYEMEFDSSDGEAVVRCEELYIIPETVTKELFDKYFIIDKIVKAQNTNGFEHKWIQEEYCGDYGRAPSDPNNTETADGKCSWEDHERWFDKMIGDSIKSSHDDLDIAIHSVNYDDVFCGRMAVIIQPETDEEYNCYFEMKLEEMTKDKNIHLPKNALIQIPSQMNHLYNQNKYGDYYILDTYDHRVYDYMSYDTIRYGYVFHVSELQKMIIDLCVDRELSPHIIGKSGKRIQETIKSLYAAGFTNVRRINIISV